MRTLPFVPALLAMVLLLHAAGILARNVGLHQDALWDFTPAVGMIRADSLVAAQEIRLFGYSLPLVTGPYQGALKTWLLAPLLGILGTSPGFLLTLNVLFSMSYLAALYWALFPAAGKYWALLVFAAPFVDANFLLVAPTDTGPFLFQCIFISLASGSLFRYISRWQRKHLWAAWFFAGCTLAQKLTSIPIVITLSLFLAAISLRPLLQTAKAEKIGTALRAFILVPAALFVIPMVPHCIYFLKSGFTDLWTMTAVNEQISYYAALVRNVSSFSSMLDGVDWYRRIVLDADGVVPASHLLPRFVAVVMGFSFLISIVSGKLRRKGRFAFTAIMLTVSSFALYPAFQGLSRPWHFCVLVPLFQCCCVLCMAHCASLFAECGKKHLAVLFWAFPAAFGFCIVLGSLQGFGLLKRIENLRGTCLTSPSLYDAYRIVQASNIRTLTSINYSVAEPIYVLSKGRIRGESLAWTDLTPEKVTKLLDAVRDNPDAGITYRYCRTRDWDPGWIQWLNHEPGIGEFFNQLEKRKEMLRIEKTLDSRQTEFGTIVRAGE